MANLARTRRPSGQIATLLLLLTIAILIVTLAMANLGHLSLTTTRVANTADAATLNLGSQLATHANSLWHALGERIERCRRTGLLALVLAIIVAIILVVVTCWATACTTTPATLMEYLGTVGALIGAGAVGGAIGGSIGGAIAGTGAAQGAAQGAAVGAAIGSAFAAAVVPAPVPLSAAAGEVAEFGLLAVPAAPAAATSATTLALAGSGAATLSAASSLYAGAMREQMTSDAFSVTARQLNALPEYDRIRESVFLDALNRTVDDPNRTAKNRGDTAGCYWPTLDPDAVGDPNDADGDGNKTEQIPCFEYWIDRRVAKLKEGLPQVGAAITAFLNGPLTTFETQAEAAYGGGGSRCGDQVCETDEECGWASVCEQDCGVCPSSDGGGGDGGGSGE